jgi:hypothetical protein
VAQTLEPVWTIVMYPGGANDVPPAIDVRTDQLPVKGVAGGGAKRA